MKMTWGKPTPSVQTCHLDPRRFQQECNCEKLLSLMCSWFWPRALLRTEVLVLPSTGSEMQGAKGQVMQQAGHGPPRAARRVGLP